MTHKDSNQPLLQLDVRDQAFLRAALDPEYLNKLLDESYSRRLKEEMPHNTQFENRVWAAIYTKLTNLKSGQSFKFIFQINTTTYFQSYYKRDDGCVLIEIISRNPTQGKTLRSLEAVASIEKVFSNPVGVLVAAITNPEIEIIFAP